MAQTILKARSLLWVLPLAALLAGCGGGGSDAASPGWSVTGRQDILEIAYGSGSDYPQYAALHATDSSLRMVYGRNSEWGTSVILLPAFWSGGQYYQGDRVTTEYATVPRTALPFEGQPAHGSRAGSIPISIGAKLTSVVWQVAGANLSVSWTGSIGGLQVAGSVLFEPPSAGRLRATVTVDSVVGDVALDNRPGEAFKPVTLTSMHVSEQSWDAQAAYAGDASLALPESGLITQSPALGTTFGLRGGTSSTKTNAPTVDVVLDTPLQITGWVTPSADPMAANVGFWAASDTLLRSWRYVVTAQP